MTKLLNMICFFFGSRLLGSLKEISLHIVIFCFACLGTTQAVAQTRGNPGKLQAGYCHGDGAARWHSSTMKIEDYSYLIFLLDIMTTVPPPPFSHLTLLQITSFTTSGRFSPTLTTRAAGWRATSSSTSASSPRGTLSRFRPRASGTRMTLRQGTLLYWAGSF